VGRGLAGDAVPGFDPPDARALAHSLLPGTALAFLLVEHGSAQPLFDAIAEAGGALLGEGFLTAETGILAEAEVAAAEDAARGIAAAQAAEPGRRCSPWLPKTRQPRQSLPPRRSALPPPLAQSRRWSRPAWWRRHPPLPSGQRR